MATSISSPTNGAAAVAELTPTPTLQQMRTQLTAALQRIASTTTDKDLQKTLKDVKATDPSPKGFPAGVGWASAYQMVARRIEDNSPATPGNLVLSEDLLNLNLQATKKLNALGVTDLSRFPRGTSVSGAIDALYRDSTNGVLVSEFAKSGIYDLTAFPAGTSAFAAFKMIEDPQKPGEISTDVYRNYKAATGALKALGITTLVNFPRGTTVIEAQNTLQPKAETMLDMLGIPKAKYGDYFTDSKIDPLSALSVLVQLPNSITKLNPLDRSKIAALPASVAAAPELERGRELARQANAAKNLVALGYDSVAPFASMARFAGKTLNPLDAFTTAKLKPAPLDLPRPTATNTERLFQPTPAELKRSFGQPNPVTKSVFTPPSSQRVTPNPPATNVTVVNAAWVIAFNQKFWGARGG